MEQITLYIVLFRVSDRCCIRTCQQLSDAMALLRSSPGSGSVANALWVNRLDAWQIFCVEKMNQNPPLPGGQKVSFECWHSSRDAEAFAQQERVVQLFNCQDPVVKHFVLLLALLSSSLSKVEKDAYHLQNVEINK